MNDGGSVPGMATTETIPRWDLSPIFAGIDDRSFSGAVEGIYASVDRLVALFDEHDIREVVDKRPVTDADVDALEAVLAEVNDVQTQMRIVSTYLYALVTTDSRDDAAAANMVELQTRSAALGPLMKRLGSWVAGLGVDELAGAQRPRRRAPVRAAEVRGGRRLPDERSRGVARGRARAFGIAGVVAAAR